MGMEGKLRQVSEFELGAYRKDPSKFYSEFLAKFESENFTKFTSMIQELQASPVARRVQERAISGLPPLQEDLDALRKQQETLLKDNKSVFDEVTANMMGLSKDNSQLSLYKDWHMLHYVLSGKSWGPVDSPLGMAIMGGAELPDTQRVMGYGPARYLSPSQVREVALALSDFPFADRAATYDHMAAESAKVYPPRYPNEPLAEDEKQALTNYFNLLRDFYADAAKKGNAIILWVE